MILATILLGGFLGATLVRLAPGFDSDEQELDLRLSEDSLQSLRQARQQERNIFRFYAQYLSGLLVGNLGQSRSLNQPISELLGDRIPVTFRSVSIGLMIGWFVALALALPTAASDFPVYELITSLTSGLFLCLPAAALGLLFLFWDGPAPLAIGLSVFPRVFRYVRKVFQESRGLPHIVTAKAKGLGTVRVVLCHIVTPGLPQLLALAGVSVSMAFGAAIPIEVICDSPGIGQLAWQAALGRDLPLLVTLTLLVTLITLVANTCSDTIMAVCGQPEQ